MSIRIKEMNRQDLLKKVLLNEHNIKEYKLIYNKNGKPTIADKNIYFNISTSNNVSAIITSNKYEVGICIKHYFYDEYIINNYFNEKENKIIKMSKNKEYDFTKIYTLKIAYIKMLGLNQDYPLKSIDTTKLQYWQTIENKNYIVSAIKNNKII